MVSSWRVLLGRREAAYAAAPSVDSAFDARSSRTMRCTRMSVTDFFVLSLAMYQVEFDDLMSVGAIGFIQAVDCARICAQKSAHQGNLRKRSCRNDLKSHDTALQRLGHSGLLMRWSRVRAPPGSPKFFLLN